MRTSIEPKCSNAEHVWRQTSARQDHLGVVHQIDYCEACGSYRYVAKSPNDSEFHFAYEPDPARETTP